MWSFHKVTLPLARTIGKLNKYSISTKKGWQESLANPLCVQSPTLISHFIRLSLFYNCFKHTHYKGY